MHKCDVYKGVALQHVLYSELRLWSKYKSSVNLKYSIVNSQATISSDKYKLVKGQAKTHNRNATINIGQIFDRRSTDCSGVPPPCVYVVITFVM